MKIYVTEKGITLVGKAWEVTNKLKQYQKQFRTVCEWQNNVTNERQSILQRCKCHKKRRHRLETFFPSL